MTRRPWTARRKAGAVLGGAALASLAAAVVVLGVVGIPATVSAGGQADVCGMKVGVTASDEGVRLPGLTGALSVGDRARIAPLCVVEIVRVETTSVDPDADGGGARVHLRWRLW